MKFTNAGRQYTNLQQQAAAVGLGERWPEVVEAYHQVDQELGELIKVTPSSKAVSDFALWVVQNDNRWWSCCRASWGSRRMASRRSCSGQR